MNKNYRRIRAGMGIGDALYLQSIVRHLIKKGYYLEVCTAWQEIFQWLDQSHIRYAEFSRNNIQYTCHYVTRKSNDHTDQFQDMCISAKQGESIELKLDYKKPMDWCPAYFEWPLEAEGKKIMVVQMPRAPFNRADGFGKELSPNFRLIENLLELYKDEFYIVQIGKGAPAHHYKVLDLDLVNRTTVTEMIHVCAAADVIVGQCSFIVPMAESLGKKLFTIWARKALQSPTRFIRRILPHKVLHYDKDAWAWDDEHIEDIKQKADGTIKA